jgi:hypothetical protein
LARVFAVSTDGTVRRDARSIADGTFPLEGLPPGTYDLFVAHDVGFAYRSGVTLEGSADLVLTSGVKVAVVFTDEKGAPLANATVRMDVLKLDGVRVGTAAVHHSASRKTDANGSVEWTLPAGTVETTAATDEKLRGEARIVVHAGAAPATIVLKGR